MSAAIFDADEQDGFVTDLAGTGIEYRVRWIGPVLRGEDWIINVAMKKFGVQTWHPRFTKHTDILFRESARFHGRLDLSADDLACGTVFKVTLQFCRLQLDPQVSKRRFGALISVDARWVQSIAASARTRIDERQL